MSAFVALHRLGRIAYEPALRWQRATAATLLAGRGGEALALLEHEPVFTFGARGDRRHLLTPVADLEARGARVLDVDRGGDVTFHGPGQLVAYPILHLRRRGLRAADYVRALERTLISTLERFGVAGERIAGRPGVWAGGAKIAAVGVRIERGVSRHGVALNVAPDLGWFDAIVPCGIADAEVTSMERLLGVAPALDAVAVAFAGAFEREFDAELVAAPETELAHAG